MKKHLRRVRPVPKPAPSRVTPDHGPGGMGECDWSPYLITYTTEVQQTLKVFSYVLTHSTRKYLDAYLDEDLFALMDGHVHAFEHFGGAPRRSKYDSQKPVVLHWEGQQPIFNPRFLAFAAHYEFEVTAVRGNPNGKPRVERGFFEHEKSFLSGREFRDLEDFRAQLRVWRERIVDHRRRHGSTALERFEHERPHLLPLPRHPYDTPRHPPRLPTQLALRGTRGAGPRLGSRPRRLPALQHRWVRGLAGQPLRGPLRSRHRHPPHLRHAARALRLRSRAPLPRPLRARPAGTAPTAGSLPLSPGSGPAARDRRRPTSSRLRADGGRRRGVLSRPRNHLAPGLAPPRASHLAAARTLRNPVRRRRLRPRAALRGPRAHGHRTHPRRSASAAHPR
ncbi:MAG: transposase [Polyangiaceae bacterium]|nr:transposase [Polyangiaceae bacterium]